MQSSLGNIGLKVFHRNQGRMGVGRGIVLKWQCAMTRSD